MLRLWLLAAHALRLAGAAGLAGGSCAFEDSACGYEWDYGHLPWTLNGEGHYISVDTSHEGERAILSSPELHSEEWSCIRLIYQIATTSASSSDPTRLNLYLRQEGESFDRLLWSAKEPSDSWLIASLDLANSTKKYKIVLEGELGKDKSASIAVFEIKITPGYCIECDFEENHLCGFMNRWNPNVNWFVGGGNIRSSQSVLPKDHTRNSELGHYMYVDSVYVKHFQEVAQLISPKTTAPMSGCLSFYYQLKQESSIVFTVYLRDMSGFYEEIWKTESALSAGWTLAEVDFDAPYPMEVIFEVAFNSAKGGYVALDDIAFSPVYCSNQTGISFNPAEASCNFEEDLCNFYQDHKDGPGWSRVKVKRNVYRTGDHTTGFGYYLLANTKFTSQPGYIGRLYGPTLPGNLQYCLRFYYALYGFFKMSGTLAVYIFEENHMVQEKIWSVLDSPKGVWTQAEISFKKPMPCKLSCLSVGSSRWGEKRRKKLREYPLSFCTLRSAGGKKPNALREEGSSACGNAQKPSACSLGLVMGKYFLPTKHISECETTVWGHLCEGKDQKHIFRKEKKQQPVGLWQIFGVVDPACQAGHAPLPNYVIRSH
ncbi:MAM domain-containing protein 2-like isoform X3 [Dromaius novaehollandiae]|uniref:MAM domain-containing protein 2-like isoform X3 n=1 Tax=Dromaius novaehollandiae TaxID=8790 RepID=UPI00311F4990